jgi:adenylyl cyclase-associated protein
MMMTSIQGCAEKHADEHVRDPVQVEWIQSFYQIFRDLTEYVKQYYPNGNPWNAKGQPAADVAKALASSNTVAAPPPPAPPAASGALPPPPPPPGPPPVLQIKEEAPSQKADSGLGAVFGEINKGSDVTKGLRKVDKSQMTHKNPSLRASSTVSDADSSVRGKSLAPGKKPKPESMRVKKPPRKELDGNKWTIVRLHFQGHGCVD